VEKQKGLITLLAANFSQHEEQEEQLFYTIKKLLSEVKEKFQRLTSNKRPRRDGQGGDFSRAHQQRRRAEGAEESLKEQACGFR
jgi:hypothetical protein